MKTILSIVALFCLTLLPAPARAEVIFLLQCDSIQGESTVTDHVGEVDLMSFSSSIFQSGLTYAPGNANAALAKMRPVVINKRLDKSSGLFFLACATGQHIPRVKLRAIYVNEPGAGPNGEFFTIILDDVQVASVNTSGNDERANGGELSETIGLSFSKIQLRYRSVKPDGTLSNDSAVGFDMKANNKLNVQ